MPIPPSLLPGWEQLSYWTLARKCCFNSLPAMANSAQWINAPSWLGISALRNNNTGASLSAMRGRLVAKKDAVKTGGITVFFAALVWFETRRSLRRSVESKLVRDTRNWRSPVPGRWYLPVA